jgi:hypothetical protein
VSSEYLAAFYEQLYKDGWHLDCTLYMKTENDERWVIEATQGKQRFATEGQTMDEAIWQLYYLIEAKIN